MAGALHGVLASLKAAAGAATDAFFRYVSLLLNTTSTNGAQNNTFLDSSTNAFSITRNGNTTQGTFSPFSQTGWSNFFDGNGDNLSIAHNTALNLASGDFTIEAFVYWSGSSANGTIINKDGLIASSYPSYDISLNGSGLVICYIGSGNGTSSIQSITSSTAFPANTWTHLAFVKNGTTLTLYQNGTSVASATQTATITDGGKALLIGYHAGQPSNYYFNGYISNARVVKGTAVYTSNFTPPTSPLTAITNTSLLTCQSNRFIDNSSNNFTITRNGDVSVQAFSPFAPAAAWSAATYGGSGYFDGTGDYLSAASDAAFALPAAFTFEVWLWPVVFNQTFLRGDTIFASIATSGLTVGRTDSGTGNRWGVAESNVAWRLTTTTLPTNAMWNHMVVVRDSSNNMALFLNGTRVANATITTSFAQNAITIGSDNNQTGSYITGYMSGMRLVKGTAVYDPTLTTLTVPTAPFTAITNTSLLLNFTNAGIYDSASGNDLETVGNAQVSTTQAKWGTTSMAFDGTGDWLVVPNARGLRFGAANFTIELWYYPTNVTGVRQIFNTSSGPTGAANNSYALITNGTSLLYYLSSTGTSWDIASGVSGGTVALNTWHHIALVRNGSTFNVYLNGTAGTSTTSSASLFAFTSPLGIGADLQSSPTPIIGYIDDLRITNGVARYTSNFTAPTAAFPLQ